MAVFSCTVQQIFVACLFTQWFVYLNPLPLYCCAVLSHLVITDSWRPHGLQPARLLYPWGFSKQEYQSGLPCPPPGDLLNPESNPGLLHCRWTLYHLSQQGSPKILEWVAYPSPGDLPNPGIELGSPALQVDSLPAELPGKPDLHISLPLFPLPTGNHQFVLYIYKSMSVLLYAFIC